MTIVKEKRKYPRISFEDRVGYVLFNNAREKIGHGFGRTINLSQAGVLLATEKILEGAFIVLVTMDLEGKKIQVKGNVVTNRYHNDSGCFLTGIKFIGSKDVQIDAIKTFVKVHSHRKHATTDWQLSINANP